MIKGPRFQIVKQFFSNGSIWLLGRQHWKLALLWAAIQACHMVRLGQAGPLVGLATAPTGAPGQLLCTGLCTVSFKECPHEAVLARESLWQGASLREAGCSQTLLLCTHACICPWPRPLKPAHTGKLEAWGWGSLMTLGQLPSKGKLHLGRTMKLTIGKRVFEGVHFGPLYPCPA